MPNEILKMEQNWAIRKEHGHAARRRLLWALFLVLQTVFAVLVRIIATTVLRSHVFGKHYKSDFDKVIWEGILCPGEVLQVKRSRVKEKHMIKPGSGTWTWLIWKDSLIEPAKYFSLTLSLVLWDTLNFHLCDMRAHAGQSWLAFQVLYHLPISVCRWINCRFNSFWKIIDESNMHTLWCVYSLKTLPFRGNRIQHTLQVKISNPTQYWCYIPQGKKTQNGWADDFLSHFILDFKKSYYNHYLYFKIGFLKNNNILLQEAVQYDCLFLLNCEPLKILNSILIHLCPDPSPVSGIQ